MIEYIDFDDVKKQGVSQCQRLFHGRGKAYEGWAHVNIDWLPPVALISLYEEETTDRLYALVQAIRQGLPECVSVQVKYCCRPMAPFDVLWGSAYQELTVDERGLKYHVQLGRSQNIGLFLDMVNGRSWVKDNARNKRVLNLFAYTCAFSVSALAGGASHVVNVDMSKVSLNKGRDNHRLNGQDLRRVTFEGVNIFKSYSRLKKYGPYDLLICDPPQFQKGSVDIKRDYIKIIRRIPELMNPKSLLMLCLNAPELKAEFLHDMLTSVCPQCHFIKALSPPLVFKEPQKGKGLKTFLYSYQG